MKKLKPNMKKEKTVGKISAENYWNDSMTLQSNIF